MATCFSSIINFSFIISSSNSSADGPRVTSCTYSQAVSFGKISICQMNESIFDMEDYFTTVAYSGEDITTDNELTLAAASVLAAASA